MTAKEILMSAIDLEEGEVYELVCPSEGKMHSLRQQLLRARSLLEKDLPHLAAPLRISADKKTLTVRLYRDSKGVVLVKKTKGGMVLSSISIDTPEYVIPEAIEPPQDAVEEKEE